MAPVHERGRRDIDGGWAWVVLAAQFLWLFISMGVQKGYGLIFVELLDRLGTTTFQTSLMSLGTCVVGAVGGGVAGFLSDKMSMRPVMLIASVIGAVGLLILAFAWNLPIAFLGRCIFHASSNGIIHVSMLGGINKYFIRKRALANTLAASGGSFGGLIVPLFITYFVTFQGYTQCVILLAGVWMHSCLSGVILRPPPVQTSSIIVEKDKNEVVKIIQHKSNTQLDDEHSLEENHPLNAQGSNTGRLGFLRKPQVLRYLLALALSSVGYLNWFLFMPSFILEQGLTKADASLCVALASLTEGITRPIVGTILNRRNKVRDKPLVVAVCCLVAGLSTMGFSFYTTMWSMVVYSILFGCTAGLFLTLTTPMMADHTPPQQIGALAGMYGICSTFGGFMSPLFGLLVDLTGWFYNAMRVIAIIYLSTSVIYIFNATRAQRTSIKQPL